MALTLCIPNSLADVSYSYDLSNPARAAGGPTLPSLQPQRSSDAGPPTAADAPGGGGYTSPTLLFIPAVAVPKWNVRVVTLMELQSPSDIHAGFRPGIGGELGLPGGFTVGAGTNWVGGDVSPTNGKTDFNLGLSPYFQARGHIFGSADGKGFQLGAAVIYKFVGFEGDPGEGELAVSAQYRRARYEAGLQGVMGQDFADSSHHDGEIHVYAVFRVIPQLALGGAAQLRVAIAPPPVGATVSDYDAIAGAIGSFTFGHYQLGALFGASTLGLDHGHVGGFGQLFGSARF
jgi:hypothetical protein